MPAEQDPADWDDRRRKVYKRDGYECQAPNCDAKGGPRGDTELHAHHITPKSQGGSHDYDNLVTLCKSCHNNQHAHDITRDGPSRPPLTSPAGTVKVWILKNIIVPFALPILFAIGAIWILQTGLEYGIIGGVFGAVAIFGIGWGVFLGLPSQTLAGYGMHTLLWGFYVFAEDGVVADIWQFGLTHADGNALGAVLLLPITGIILTVPMWVAVFGFVAGWIDDDTEIESDASPSPENQSTTGTHSSSADPSTDPPEDAVSWDGLTSEAVETELYEHGIYRPADIIDVGESLRAIPILDRDDLDTLFEFSTAALGALDRPDEPMTPDRAVNWSDRPNVTAADEAALYERGIYTIEAVLDIYDSLDCIDGLSDSGATIIREFAVSFAELSDNHSVPSDIPDSDKPNWRGLDTVHIDS